MESEEEGQMEEIADPQEESDFLYKLWLSFQSMLDRIVIYRFYRWTATVMLLMFYIYRAMLMDGLHVITYFLGLYMLDKFLGFISPKEEEDVVLPTRESDEFRPFRRAVKEIDLWTAYSVAISLSIVLSYIELFNIPVFWPLLVMYFVLVMVVAFKTKISHMIKYRYVPYDFGKRKYERV